VYKNLKISLVIPAFNEERLIKSTLDGVTKTIDRVYVIDDCSTDKTSSIVQGMSKKDKRIHLLRHRKNAGVGRAIITGYKQSAKDGYDVAVVIGGDNQMDLADLPNFLEPIAKGEADYVKGNRFLWRSLESMPKHRHFGNSTLSLLTKVASGYWKVFDTQDGYTATTRKVIETLDWNRAWKGYGYVSEWLIRLNVHGFRVKDVPRRPVYLPDERQSQIKIGRYILRVVPMLIRRFFWRIKERYIIRDFHPLAFLYILSFILLPIGFIYGVWLLWYSFFIGSISSSNAIFVALLIITGFLSLVFAMLFDMESSK
jgi:glycosyltransferase involved in cell wall biosynthesis